MRQMTRSFSKLLISASLLAMPANSAMAAKRSYIVTDFDQIRLEAPIILSVKTKRAVTAQGEGASDALERIDLRVVGHTLTVRLKPTQLDERGNGSIDQVHLSLTVSSLQSFELAGAGTATIDAMVGPKLDLVSAGGGDVSVTGLQVDRLSVVQVGNGRMVLAGKAGSVSMRMSGSGRIDAIALSVADLNLEASGAGSIAALATRAAKMTVVGAATVQIDGRPACSVQHVGSGKVSCGGQVY